MEVMQSHTSAWLMLLDMPSCTGLLLCFAQCYTGAGYPGESSRDTADPKDGPRLYHDSCRRCSLLHSQRGSRRAIPRTNTVK